MTVVHYSDITQAIDNITEKRSQIVAETLEIRNLNRNAGTAVRGFSVVNVTHR